MDERRPAGAVGRGATVVSTALAVDPVLRITLRVALALLFFWAAAHKLRDVAGFKAALAAYALVPQPCLGACASVLIAAEVVVATGLLAFARPHQSESGLGVGAAMTAAGLLCVYSAAIVVNLLRGRRHIDCGCFGAAKRRPLGSGLVARNAVLAIVAAASALPAASRSLTWIDSMTIGAGVAVLALLYAAVDGLIATAPRSAALARGRASHLRREVVEL
jgi:hypothetical protein